MIAVIFRFPGGRYHATPPGHHVNEGVVEWPPSPWRLLRALLSVGYTKLEWSEPGQVARTLIEKLAANPPKYRLPQATTGHSRHYMPVGKLDKGRERTTLVFDTWAEIPRGELGVSWDAALDSEERDLLSRLVENIGYLGRSESWVEARLADEFDGSMNGHSLALPCETSARPGIAWEQVALLAPEPAQEYATWRAARLAAEAKAAEESAPSAPHAKQKKGKTKGKGRVSSSDAAFPPDLLACLQVDSTWIEASGWTQPPGSRRVLYWRSATALESGAYPLQSPSPHVPPVEAMLLAFATPSGNQQALPTNARTLPQAELVHRALVSHVIREQGSMREVFTGKTADGAPLVGHRHAHLLPLDLDSDGHLDHLLIWAPMGVAADAQRAVKALRRTWMKGGVGELRVALAGAGSLNDLRAVRASIGQTLRKTLGPMEGARVWESESPFIAPRHVKERGRCSLEGQVADELVSRGLPTAASVTVLEANSPEGIAMRHFVRVRRRGPTPPADSWFRLRLEFTEPVAGPICLGYASHFGLGRFVAAD